MFIVKKTMEIAAAHMLSFAETGTTEPLHGHNWRVTMYCRSSQLDENGMVLDFEDIKSQIFDYLDHSDLNSTLPYSPTTENFAKWVCERFTKCYKVEVQECEGNIAIYEEQSDE